MWPFGSQSNGSSGGCNAHHFEVDRVFNSEYRLEYDYGLVHFKQRAVMECQHEGCNATKEDWVTFDKAHYQNRDNIAGIYRSIDRIARNANRD